MDLPEGFHKEVIEARESRKGVDFTDSRISFIVETTPLKPGGSNFKTHALNKKSLSKLAYRPSVGGALFSFLFLAVGIGIITYNMIVFLGLSTIPKPSNFILLAIGVAFSIVGGYLCYMMYLPRVFDKQLGFYYKAYKVNLHDYRKDSKNQIDLKSIVAVQIIGEHVSSDDGSYKSFELNLVLDDKSRRNVVDHGNLKSIIDDAHIISEFLDVPIWHAKTNEN